MADVNPKILAWARATAEFTPEEAADKLGLPVERLIEMEDGKREPSRNQILKMSTVYRRPLIAFYLKEPPQRNERAHDYRTLNVEAHPKEEAVLAALVRDVIARQELIKQALVEVDEAPVLSFVGSLNQRTPVTEAVTAIEKILQFDKASFRSARTIDEAFKALRDAVEKAGIFVLLAGNLGSYHSDISVDVFRGFCIADEVAPFIVINEHDARSAWSFTLVHELCHILMGQTAISGYNSEKAVEKYCDSVAARFLISAGELGRTRMEIRSGRKLALDAIAEMASAAKVSRAMVAYNLMDTGAITTEEYNELVERFKREREQSEKAKPKGSPDYYVVRRHRVGPGLVSAVTRLVSEGVLSSPKAGKVLGVKATGVARITGDAA